MQLGDQVTFTPTAFEGEISGQSDGRREKARALTGRVVYIHPKRRFYTVAAECNGYVVRESFLFKKH